jgi:hypothetical protein
MQVIWHVINNTTPVTTSHGFAPDFGEDHNELIEEGDGQAIAVEAYKQALADFADLSDQERMEADPYTTLYEHASICITALGEKLGFSSDVMTARLDAWLFAPPDEVRFPLDSVALSSPDQIWRIAH